mmetsp:Transcript_28811/g.52920  ORF Transcript_28811/g.52920 Transcript_28811/m.52920 type:complete len:103 (-) Transcript_28811:930-1238(-)
MAGSKKEEDEEGRDGGTIAGGDSSVPEAAVEREGERAEWRRRATDESEKARVRGEGAQEEEAKGEEGGERGSVSKRPTSRDNRLPSATCNAAVVAQRVPWIV